MASDRMIAGTQEPMPTAKAHEWRMIAEKALAALAERDKPCVWRQEADGWYMTQCENAFADMQGTYCPGCGHPIEVAA